MRRCKRLLLKISSSSVRRRTAQKDAGTCPNAPNANVRVDASTGSACDAVSYARRDKKKQLDKNAEYPRLAKGNNK